MASNPINPVPPVNGKPDTKYQHKPWRCGEPQDYVVPMPKNGEGKPLHHIYERMNNFDQESCEAWRDEIEHLLIFAGLFSATVTAFLVDSYKWLRVDNSIVSTQLLVQISRQLGAIANNATPVPPATLDPFTADPRFVRINVMWFLSLIMCLSTVIFGILCLQWLREYTRNMEFSSADAITIRQMRYDGLWRWKVPTVIAWLPIILQTSVLLFFAGILDLLWSLHQVVAAVITAAVGLVALGIFFTTIAPVIQTIHFFHHFNKQPDPNTYVAPCAYRSPVSWVLLRLIMYLDPILVWQRHKRTSWAEFDIFFHEKSKQNIHGQRTYNPKGLARAIRWLMNKLSPELNQDIPRDVYHSLHSSIDRSVAGSVLSEWVTMTEEAKNTKATSEDALRLGMHQARYDLLLERLLRQCSPIKDNRGVLLELQVRCLNTFDDNEAMVEVYSEAASNCHFHCKENQDPFHLEENGLLFQAVMTLLRLHNRLCREPFTEHHVGSILAPLIRNTPVNEDNAELCYQILHQFKLLLDEILNSCGDSFGASGNGMDPRSVSLLLHKLDLRSVRQWEAAIQKFTGNEVGVTGSLTLFMGNLMPTLEKCGLESNAGEIKSQLVAFHENQPHTYHYVF